MRRTARWLAGVLCVGTCSLSGACGGDAETTQPEALVCDGGQRWVLGLLGSPQMNPGEPCVNCHGASSRPTFTVAGTVYESLDAADDCYGSRGVTVEIQDADGRTVSAKTNNAGNFYLQDEMLTLPLSASISRDGEVRAMLGEVPTGECNGCHTASGANGAAGRIIIAN